MARVGRRGLSGLLGTRGKEFGYAQITLRGRRQKVILGVKVCVQIRVENIGGLAMGRNNQGRQMVWDGRMGR